jgi:hypothetical protein
MYLLISKMHVYNCRKDSIISINLAKPVIIGCHFEVFLQSFKASKQPFLMKKSQIKKPDGTFLMSLAYFRARL